MKVKPIEKAAGISNSALVNAVDGARPLAEKHKAPLEKWAAKFLATIPGGKSAKSDVPPPEAPKKPKAAPKATAAPKSKPSPVEPKPRDKAKEPAVSPDNKLRIAELEKELKNPPKNPAVGIKVWKKVREDELRRLKG